MPADADEGMRKQFIENLEQAFSDALSRGDDDAAKKIPHSIFHQISVHYKQTDVQEDVLSAGSRRVRYYA